MQPRPASPEGWWQVGIWAGSSGPSPLHNVLPRANWRKQRPSCGSSLLVTSPAPPHPEPSSLRGSHLLRPPAQARGPRARKAVTPHPPCKSPQLPLLLPLLQGEPNMRTKQETAPPMAAMATATRQGQRPWSTPRGPPSLLSTSLAPRPRPPCPALSQRQFWTLTDTRHCVACLVDLGPLGPWPQPRQCDLDGNWGRPSPRSQEN